MRNAPVTRFYHDHLFNVRAAYINPGGMHVTQEDIALVTTLGSCVSACLRDPVTGIGGMNHFLLSESHEFGEMRGIAGAYGPTAMAELVNRIVSAGGSRWRLEAKVFGGARMYEAMEGHVGNRNVDFVLEWLRNASINVLSQSLRQDCPRRVYYFPRTGDAYVKRMSMSRRRGTHGDDSAGPEGSA